MAMTVANRMTSLRNYFQVENNYLVAAVTEWIEARHLDENTLNLLFTTIIQECQWFPKIAEVVSILNRLQGSDASKAFQTAMAAARLAGSYNSVSFEDGKIAQCIRSGWGNWLHFCIDEQGSEWLRKKFIDMYETLVGGDFPKRLAGMYEAKGLKYDHFNFQIDGTTRTKQVGGGERLAIEGLDDRIKAIGVF